MLSSLTFNFGNLAPADDSAQEPTSKKAKLTPEDINTKFTKAKLKNLYKMFQSMCWKYFCCVSGVDISQIAEVSEEQPEKGIGLEGLLSLFEKAGVDPTDVRTRIAELRMARQGLMFANRSPRLYWLGK
jgi:hypothetical protein